VERKREFYKCTKVVGVLSHVLGRVVSLKIGVRAGDEGGSENQKTLAMDVTDVLRAK
jgi:hypothetical protein